MAHPKDDVQVTALFLLFLSLSQALALIPSAPLLGPSPASATALESYKRMNYPVCTTDHGWVGLNYRPTDCLKAFNDFRQTVRELGKKEYEILGLGATAYGPRENLQSPIKFEVGIDSHFQTTQFSDEA